MRMATGKRPRPRPSRPAHAKGPGSASGSPKQRRNADPRPPIGDPRPEGLDPEPDHKPARQPLELDDTRDPDHRGPFAESGPPDWQPISEVNGRLARRRLMGPPATRAGSGAFGTDVEPDWLRRRRLVRQAVPLDQWRTTRDQDAQEDEVEPATRLALSPSDIALAALPLAVGLVLLYLGWDRTP